jgi:transcription elongation factor GreA
MTQEGYDLLLKEFKFLKDVEKPQVNREKQEAAAQGDRSENAEYHAAKEKLRHIDKRLFYLNSMIEKALIINPDELGNERVHFGSTVELLDLDSDEEFRYTICGVLESEPDNALISVHAPLSRAVMGKCVGDEFKIKLPSGIKNYEVTDISYTPIFSLKKVIRDEKDFTFK